MSRLVNVGRPWTPYEDQLLTDAVRIHGENTEKWKIIAIAVPGRTNKACRKRWLHSLSPKLKKCAWSPDEDRMLLELFDKHPNKWSVIAREIPGRTDDACSKRYREALDPRLRKDEWSEEEDRRLLELLARDVRASKVTGGGGSCPKWGRIGQELSRSGLSCRNRWRLLERKKSAAARQTHQVRNGSKRHTQVTPGIAEAGLADVWPLFVPESEHGVFWNDPWHALDFVAHGTSTQGGSSLDMMIMDVQQHLQPAVPATNIGDTGSSQHIGHSLPFASASLGTTLSHTGTLNEASNAVGMANHCLNEHERVIELPASLPSGAVARDRTLEAEHRNSGIMDIVCTLAEKYSSNGQHAATCDASPTPTHASQGACNSSREHRANERLGADASKPSNAVCGPGTDESNVESQRKDPSTQTVSNALVSIPVEAAIHPRKRRRKATGGNIASINVGGQRSLPRLSSTLPVSTEEIILAYVCGHTSCWPVGTEESDRSRSKSCFATSGELWTHFKHTHMDKNEAITDRDSRVQTRAPFCCGLEACNKGWKSINGLQYHFQISKEHYQVALSATKNYTHSDKNAAPVADHRAVPNPDETFIADAPKKPREIAVPKVHKCPHTGCQKSYKQLSGLRYHLLHGHSMNIPTQLDSMPPTLVRKLGFSIIG